MRSLFLCIVIIIAALFLELTLAGGFSAIATQPPVLAFAFIACLWFARIKPFLKFALGGATGAILDVFSLFPFGTYAAFFLFLTAFYYYLQGIFAATHKPAVKIAGMALSLFVFLNLAPLWGIIAEWRLRNSAFTATGQMIFNNLAAAAVWTLILNAPLAAGTKIIFAFKKKEQRPFTL